MAANYFYSVSFLEKIIDLPGVNKPLSGKAILFRSSQQLPCLRLRPLNTVFLIYYSDKSFGQNGEIKEKKWL